VRCLHDIYCSGMFHILTRFSVNLGTFFILSEHVSQIDKVFLKRPNVTLEYSAFHLVFRRFWVQISPKRLVVLNIILRAL